ncbi:MAG: Hpt domain-containing protein [Anaerovoracaceae bacterium]|nr:Hpt domain-containing protein [Anaerovoracaceae bacterium]
MLTKEALDALGAETAEGIARCVDNEEFYLKLVKKVLEQDDLDQLRAAVESGDLDAAFERAHAMKGAFGNLALTSLFEQASAMTEELRSRNNIDYSVYVDQLSETLDKYRELL